MQLGIVMPKGSKIAGTERYNFMLALTGYLIQNRQQKISDLAKHFGVTEQEIREAAVTISLSGVGLYRPDELFFLDYDLLEEGIVDVSFAPTLESVPRLSTRQAAAIASGLSYLESVVDESDRVEIKALLDLLSDGGKRTSELPFKVHPSRFDSEVSLARQAIGENRLISCSYINAANEVSERKIEPISLESNDAIWYLRGYCRTKNEIRIFRLDRMRDIILLDEELVRAKYQETDASEIYSVSDSDTNVVFEIDPPGFGLLADYKPEYPAVGDKTLRVTIPIGDIATLGRVVSKYSGHVRVIEPEQARRVVFEYASRALGSSSASESVE
jgi:proteasome accessory factor C